MEESEESPCEKIVQWKSGLLKMNTGKMKVMFSCSIKDRVEEKLSGFVVYVRKQSDVIQFCAIVERNGSISDVVESKSA